jgi:hypothetical protein
LWLVEFSHSTVSVGRGFFVLVLVYPVFTEFLVAAGVVSLSFFRECVVLGYVCGISLRGVHVVWDFTRIWEDL